MQPSKIFLTFTSTLLALAGVIAAKTTHFSNVTAYYFTITQNTRCVSSVVFPCFPTGNCTSICSYTYVKGLATKWATVYTAATATTPCFNRLCDGEN